MNTTLTPEYFLLLHQASSVHHGSAFTNINWQGYSQCDDQEEPFSLHCLLEEYNAP